MPCPGHAVAVSLLLAASCAASTKTQARPPAWVETVETSALASPRAPARMWESPAPSVEATKPRFDAAAASRYLDGRMTSWMNATPQVGNNFACAMTCHTALPFAASRSALGAGDEAAMALGAHLDVRVHSVAHWKDAIPFYGARGSDTARKSLGSEAVLNAAAEALLAANGVEKAASVQPAMERMWEAQRADGGFDWLDFGLAPWENGDEIIGASFAARAVGALPPAVRGHYEEQTARLSAFVRGRLFEDPDGAAPVLRQSVSLFAAASVLEVSASLDDLLSAQQKRVVADALVRAASSDGGYSWSGLRVVPARDARGASSDALPTAIAALALRASPSDSTEQAATKAKEWLAGRQAADGSFPSRSPNRDRPFSHLVMTDAATAYAALALASLAEGRERLRNTAQ